MPEMSLTKFGRLAIGEKFRLPGSSVLLVKETLHQEAEFGPVNASYCYAHQGRPCFFSDDMQVIPRRSNEGKAGSVKAQSLEYQCVSCRQWVVENDAAMSKEGVMCLDCYALALKHK